MSRTVGLVLVVLGVITLMLAMAGRSVTSLQFFHHQTIVFGVLGLALTVAGAYGLLGGGRTRA